MTVHLSLLSKRLPLSFGQPVTLKVQQLPLSCGQRVTFKVPELPLSCGQWVTFGVPELPLSCGQRVTFFAGAKKVTKETPSRAEPAQEDTIGSWKACEESRAQLGLRRSAGAASDCFSTDSWHRSALGHELVSLRRTSCLWNLSRVRRFSARRTWARSDSERCFFGDFLCTGKESYPLAAGQRKLSLLERYMLAAGQRKLWLLERYMLAAGQRKLWLLERCMLAAGQRKQRHSGAAA
jgi:hypothetical protein